MKKLLIVFFILLGLRSQAQQVKPDSLAHWPPPVGYALPDSLQPGHRDRVEITLLRQQNERLMDKSGRFWALVIIAVVAALARAVSN